MFLPILFLKYLDFVLPVLILLILNVAVITTLTIFGFFQVIPIPGLFFIALNQFVGLVFPVSIVHHFKVSKVAPHGFL